MWMNKFWIIALIFFSLNSYTQSVAGELSLLAGKIVKLEGFNGLQTYAISSTIADSNGYFSLRYSTADLGIGYLVSANEKPFIIILSGEDIAIEGEALSRTETLRTTKGQENRWFEQYAREHPKREQALSAWLYLEKMYQQDELFSEQEVPKNAIKAEKSRIKNADGDFIESLPKDSYVRWFLPTRKLVSSVSMVAQYRTEEIPATITSLRTLDYTDQRLYKSGLLRDAIEGHFWLIENSGRSLDSVSIEMKISIDYLIKNLARDEKKFNEITTYLFDLLERHSLFDASEYLALKVLNEMSCTIDGNFAKQLETYRAMKKGNTAPDFNFEGDVFGAGFEGMVTPQKLSDIKSNYVLLFFGASWCPKCTEELPQINSLYKKWKDQNVEVVFVSLDEDKIAFKNAAEKLPFITVCDYQKWSSPMAEAYYIFATPTFYLLNDKREILLKPNSVKQMDAWVDWYLVQGKK